MNPIYNTINRIKSLIITDDLIKGYSIKAEELGEEEGYIRVKVDLINGGVLEFFEYLILERDSVKIDKYSFHWQDKSGQLLKRWDNARHHREIRSFPDHIHMPDGQVEVSKKLDLQNVLQIVKEEIKK
ncbi:MAG: hypothetical protein KAV18_05985 [Candidatus Omnitrophica bacterium]|nr:hypothetical protein [Candidatus Omnitrophota bacterium]